MNSKRSSGQENILIFGNNQNNPMNTQISNYSNNNYSSQNEPSQTQYKEASINIRKDLVSNSSSMRGGDSTATSNVKKFRKRKSSNKSENYIKRQLLNYNNMNENIGEVNINKEDLINNNNNNYNIGLEPILEVPPLTKIEKKQNIYDINNAEKNTKELLYPNNRISTTK